MICYSTPMSADLVAPEHARGAAHGTRVFQMLLAIIKPSVLVAHGAGTARDLGRLLEIESLTLPAGPSTEPPEQTWRPDHAAGHAVSIIAIPALSPPAWNRWATWAPGYFGRVADVVADRLGR